MDKFFPNDLQMFLFWKYFGKISTNLKFGIAVFWLKRVDV